MSWLTELATLAKESPLAFLALACVGAVFWQSQQLKREREVNRLLVNEMMLSRARGVEYSHEAERTIIKRDRRQDDKPHDPNRRKR